MSEVIHPIRTIAAQVSGADETDASVRTGMNAESLRQAIEDHLR